MQNHNITAMAIDTSMLPLIDHLRGSMSPIGQHDIDSIVNVFTLLVHVIMVILTDKTYHSFSLAIFYFAIEFNNIATGLYI